MASGLPLVCTTRTGGFDLALSNELATRISVVPAGDPVALADTLARVLDSALCTNWVELPKADRAKLSWAAYGARYKKEICSHGPGPIASS